MPRVSWRFSPTQLLTVGATIIDGPRDGYGGAYDRNDQVFVAYRLAP